MSFFHIQFQSQTLQGGGEFGVLLPDGWEQNDTCKVLYLLHGALGEYLGNLMPTSIARYCNKRGVAIVAPSSYLGVYTDMVHGEAGYSFVKEVIEQSMRMFPVLSIKPEERFLLGISMGGHGAFKLAMEIPDGFAAAAACSSPIDMVRTMELLENGLHAGGKELYDAFGGSTSYRGTVGDIINMAQKRLAKGEKLPRLFLCWGDEDHARSEDIVTVKKFENLGFHIVTRVGKGGHNFDMWETMLEDIVIWLLEGDDKNGTN